MIVESLESISASALVFDSWPILELWRQREPASGKVSQILRSCSVRKIDVQMSRISYGEIIYKAVDYLGQPSAEQKLVQLQKVVHIVSVDDQLVDEAARLKNPFRISYADCFVAALAIRRSMPVLTGDPDFLKLETAGLIDLLWLGA